MHDLCDTMKMRMRRDHYLWCMSLYGGMFIVNWGGSTEYIGWFNNNTDMRIIVRWDGMGWGCNIMIILLCLPCWCLCNVVRSIAVTSSERKNVVRIRRVSVSFSASTTKKPTDLSDAPFQSSGYQLSSYFRPKVGQPKGSHQAMEHCQGRQGWTFFFGIALWHDT